jgi:Ca2+-transporting ATPase
VAASTAQAPPTAPEAHARPAADVCVELRVDQRSGLTEPEAARRLEVAGPNRIATEPAPSRVALVARQFGNSMVLLLVGAAAISLSIGELLDAAVILAIVVANAIFGAVQEGRADQAAAAVRALLAPTAHVLRDGRVRERPAAVVVPGDVVALRAGDRIAADGRVINGTLLQVDESALTGESLARGKRPDPPDPADAPVAEHRTTVLAGTTVTRGTGGFVVTATGARTEMGRIAGAADRRHARTPLQVRLDRLTRLLIPMAGGIIATLALLSYLQGDTLAHSVLVGVSLAVAALPEGLPAVVTITLALSMRQMAERGAIVRRLAAVETLGSTTVICSDKTGTLTENRLTVQRLWAAPGFEQADLLEAAVIASSAPEQADPLELAILAAARRQGMTREDALAGRAVLGTRPFDSERKRMSVVIAEPNGTRSARIKGAPDVLISLLATPAGAVGIERIAGGWAEQGLRVLLVARRAELEGGEDPERRLEPIGLVGMADTPRPTVRASVAEARGAGVRTIMITGDHPRTAASVAAATGVARGDGPVEVVTGRELDSLSADALRDTVRWTDVFARVVPEHKVRIVEALKRDGEIAAMTGDGVNDVPALKAAHIGVAMGRRGTDAASEAADMVLTDDDYSTIVRAIRQGRAIHDNIVHFAHFLFAGNAGEVLAFALAVLLGLGAPLTVLQILLVNLLLDGLPAAALGVDPPGRGVMGRPPRPPSEGLLDRVRVRLLVGGAAIGAAIFASFLIGDQTSHVAGQTMAFTTLVFGRLLFVFTVRGDGPFWQAGRNLRLFGAVALSAAVALVVLAVPVIGDPFGTTALSPVQWFAALALAAVAFLVPELWKAGARRLAATGPQSRMRSTRAVGSGS